MSITVKEIVLASYLHDVGKFAQRADKKDLFKKEYEALVGVKQKGEWYSHQHAVYTKCFLEKFRNVLPDDVDTKAVIDLASCHHNPSSYEEWIIAQGDRLSSGSDRCNVLKENEEIQNDEVSAKFYEKPMIHILSTVKIDGRDEGKTAYCKMASLEKDAVLSSSEKKIGKEDYERLWKDFEADFQKLQDLKYNNFVPALDSLLERYWWCIPSATNADADISLYQHAKTTAAFASAIYLFQKEVGKENKVELEKNDENKFIFIKSDVSGIQKYIFDLKTTSDNAKLLRAKSFQIAMLGKIISDRIVQAFDLSGANVLTSAGGNSMILLPNTKSVRSKLEEIQKESQEYFLREFAGKLSVIISSGIEASAKDIQKENVRALINKIGTDADCAKQKKMQIALGKSGHILSDLYGALQQNGECPQCGLYPSSGLGEDGNRKPCKNCDMLKEIGGKLVKAARVSVNAKELKHFGEMVKVYRDEKSGERGLYSVNDFTGKNALLYLPYTAPKKENGDLLTFEEIAKKSTGNKKLAMFKADIDNLGFIFSSGLGKRMSFSRYADMSFMLHYFFSAFYTHFLESKSCLMTSDDGNKITVKYKDVIYTVFSGGDDLCVLGSWDAVLHFACDFHKALEDFTNHNPSVSLSAGIALGSSNVPVKNLAEEAENALEKSKARKIDDKTVKNAITVFDTTVSWGDFEDLLKAGEKIQNHLESENDKREAELSKGVVYKMIDFSKRAEAVDKGNVDVHDLAWASNFHYVVARNVKDKDLKNWLLNFGSNKDKMIKFRIAVSYALYTQRKN